MGMYKGSIYKTKNLRNLSMVQMFPDPEDLKRAQDSIENRLQSFDRNLWIPSREELQARAGTSEDDDADSEEEEEITIRDRDEDADDEAATVKEDKEEPKKEAKNKRSKRSKPKGSNVKKAKVSNSGSAVRSVRRRKP